MLTTGRMLNRTSLAVARRSLAARWSTARAHLAYKLHGGSARKRFCVTTRVGYWYTGYSMVIIYLYRSGHGTLIAHSKTACVRLLILQYHSAL